MNIVDYIAIAAILLIVGAATLYIIKAKASGKKCIGCPDSCSCNSKNDNDSPCIGCTGSCQCHEKKDDASRTE